MPFKTTYMLPISDLTWATGPDSGCLGLSGNLLVSGGQHLAALNLTSWTLSYLGPGRPREQCLVLTVTTSPLGDAVFFASGARGLYSYQKLQPIHPTQSYL